MVPAGRGPGASDLVYFLWTSVEPDVLATHEGDLLRAYHAELCQTSGALGVSALSDEELQEAYDAATLDYVRYLMGSLWSGMNPLRSAEMHGRPNHGAHRRHAGHLLRLACRAADVLSLDPRFSQRALEKDAGNAVDGTAPRRAGALTGPATGGLEEALLRDWEGLHRSRVLEFAAVGAALAEGAGEVIRRHLRALEEGRLEVNDKGAAGAEGTREGGATDPQTAADLEAEALIVGSMARAFPDLTVRRRA